MHSADGEKLGDLAGFIVERESPGLGYTRIATIDVVDGDRVRQQSRFTYVDRAPPASGASYRVRAFSADGQLGPAATAAQALDAGAGADPAGPAEPTAPSSAEDAREAAAPADRGAAGNPAGATLSP